jgi:dethiobiotin synthetase
MKIAVLGTNTEVGKTFVSTAIAKLLEDLGRDVMVLKPVETGEPDTAYLQKLGIRAKSIYRFKTPATPLLSAQIEGKKIDVDYLLMKTRTILEENDSVILEGVGGVASPIWYNFDSSDLAARLNLRVLLVAKNELGAITSTVTAAKYLEMKGAELGAILLNMSDDGVIQKSNAEIISGIIEKKVFVLKKTSFDRVKSEIRELVDFLGMRL